MLITVTKKHISSSLNIILHAKILTNTVKTSLYMTLIFLLQCHCTLNVKWNPHGYWNYNVVYIKNSAHIQKTGTSDCWISFYLCIYSFSIGNYFNWQVNINMSNTNSFWRFSECCRSTSELKSSFFFSSCWNLTLKCTGLNMMLILTLLSRSDNWPSTSGRVRTIPKNFKAVLTYWLMYSTQKGRNLKNRNVPLRNWTWQ